MTKRTPAAPINIQSIPLDVHRRHTPSKWDAHIQALASQRDTNAAQVFDNAADAKSMRGAIDTKVKQRPDLHGCKGRLSRLQDGTYAVRIIWPTPHSYPTADAQASALQAVANNYNAKRKAAMDAYKTRMATPAAAA
jgi:hypothetical protein